MNNTVAVSHFYKFEDVNVYLGSDTQLPFVLRIDILSEIVINIQYKLEKIEKKHPCEQYENRSHFQIWTNLNKDEKHIKRDI